MSFSSKIKEELSQHMPDARHCRIAETAAIISMCASVAEPYCLVMQTENFSVARKYFTLLKKTFNIEIELSIRQNKRQKKGRTYTVCIKHPEDARRVLAAVRICADAEGGMTTDGLITQQMCCKRAFLRGAFLVAGSLSDPNKFYHLEFTCTDEAKARQIQSALGAFGVDARIILRKKYYVVYLKEGDQIVDVLNIMEAHKALMELENIRILKDMRNAVNRKVNCEAANIHKTVNAAVKQIEDIQYIKDTVGFGELSDALAQMAKIRLENPDATLQELGMLVRPQIGKSGVNHRLRKLSELAAELKIKEEKQYD